MNVHRFRPAFLFLPLALLTCTDAESDPLSTVEEALDPIRIQKGSSYFQNAEILPPDPSYELILRDGDGWLIELNYEETRGAEKVGWWRGIDIYRGRLRYRIGSSVYEGEARAAFNDDLELLNIMAVDGYEGRGSISYSVTFGTPDAHQQGIFVYLQGEEARFTTLDVIRGTFTPQ